MNNIDIKRIGITALIICGVAVLWAWSGIHRHILDNESAVEVVIEEGGGVGTIAATFEELGMVKSAFLFKLYTKLSGNADQLQAGTFMVASNSSIKDIVNQLSEGGDNANEISITIIEGWSSRDIEEYLVNQGLPAEDFVESVQSFTPTEGLGSFIEGTELVNGYEGFLFPDTYAVFKDTTSEELIQRMINNFEAKVLTPEVQELTSTSDLSFYDVVTLASIVELEVRETLDRQKVAGIFLQRLADNYPLQSDVTVNYALGKKDVNTTFKDTEFDSPYNTYKYAGLPPTPMNNPSVDAIMAVLQPVSSSSYFFLTTEDGDVVYADDFEAHLVNKAKYVD